MNKELYAVLAEVSTYSSIAVYMPYASISAGAYPLPPPTTIVGALSYAYRRSLNDLRELMADGCSPAVELVEKKKVLYAAAGILKPITISKAVERLYQHVYLKKQHWKKPEMAYTVGVRPIVTVDRLQIFLIVSDKDLARYCYGMTRLGRKESLIAVDNVVVVPVREALTQNRLCDTAFYFPRSIVKDYSPRDMWMEIDMPILHRDNYSKRTTVLETYVVPKPYTGVKTTVELNDDGVALSIRTADGRVAEVPVPRRVIEA